MDKNIGIFGNGYWSKIIQSKFNTSDLARFKIKFIADSKSDYLARLDEFKLDWVIVVSANGSHYEIVETCLQKGINVFCEKPLVSSPEEARSLYQLAKERDALLYVDDVFMWRSDIRAYIDSSSANSAGGVEIKWYKSANLKNPKQSLNDLLYHDLYIAGAYLNYPKEVKIDATIRDSVIRAKVTAASKKTFNFEYQYNYSTNQHNFDALDLTKRSNDALKLMLYDVLTGVADFAKNEVRTMWTTKLLFEAKQQIMPQIGVIGAGIFGATSAILLANEGCKVTVFEKADEILTGATAKNQFRLHRGYHYPRSKQTALSSKLAYPKFRSYYRSAVIDTSRHMYAIASSDSKTTAREFENFMGDMSLSYKKIKKPDAAIKLFKSGAIEALYGVEEASYSPSDLRSLVKEKLAISGVTVNFCSKVDAQALQPKFDYVVSATYANPTILDNQYQFEICEKPLVRLSDKFRQLSLVIFDGPFLGIDPVPDTPYHLLDSVEDGIHHRNVGNSAEVPGYIKNYIDKGLVQKPNDSHLEQFINRAQQFYEDFHVLEYLGSYFVIRAVLPYRDHDDARPSFIHRINKNHYDIFSGKVSTALDLGQEIVQELIYADYE